MPWYEVVALLAAGMAAGTINTIVGSGTLITFPTLLFFGFPPLVANVSNTVGLVAGGLTGIHGYRVELAGQGSTLRRLVPASFLGAVTGAFLLLNTGKTVPKPGEGLLATVGGRRIAIGNRRLMASLAVETGELADRAAALENDGCTVIQPANQPTE